MESSFDLEGYGPFGRPRDVPLCARWDERKHFPAIEARFGLDRAGAAFSLSLVTEAMGRGRNVSVSLRRDHYTDSASRLWNYANAKRYTELAAEKGLAHVEKGSPQTRGWQTAMRAAPILIEGVSEIISTVGPPEVVMPRRLVIIRDRNGKPLNTSPSRELDRMERQVAKVNEMIASADIPDCQNGAGTRIFNQSPNRNGRFCIQGGGYQSLPKARRLALTINGEPVVEIDFKALHPSLLYARAGLPIPEDCYSVPGLERWSDDRPLVKRAFLIIINARTRQSAIGAIAHCEPMQTYLDGIEPHMREEAAGETAAALVDDIKRAHHPIAAAFHSDAGAGLMRIDSDIAMTVELDLHRQGIVALPVHDSFIVAASQEQRLLEAMFRAAEMHGLKSPRFETFRAASLIEQEQGLRRE